MSTFAELWTCPGYWTHTGLQPYHTPCTRYEYTVVGEAPERCGHEDLFGKLRQHNAMVSQGVYEFEEVFA